MKKPTYEKLSIIDAIRRVCADKNKYGIFLHIPENCEVNELGKSLTWTKDKSEILDIWLQSPYVFLLFDNREDMEYVFDNTCGDDNIGKGKFKDATISVYALTISNRGEMLNENT